MEFRRLFEAESKRQGFDLLATLIGMSNDPMLPADTRIRAMNAIVPFAYPKLRSVETVQHDPVKVVLVDASGDADPLA